jgi:hypothetical protein
LNADGNFKKVGNFVDLKKFVLTAPNPTLISLKFYSVFYEQFFLQFSEESTDF